MVTADGRSMVLKMVRLVTEGPVDPGEIPELLEEFRELPLPSRRSVWAYFLADCPRVTQDGPAWVRRGRMEDALEPLTRDPLPETEGPPTLAESISQRMVQYRRSGTGDLAELVREFMSLPASREGGRPAVWAAATSGGSVSDPRFREICRALQPGILEAFSDDL